MRSWFPEIESAAAFHQAAGGKGWPIFCDDSCSFHEPMLRELFALWQSEAQQGTPSRHALTARKLRAFMRNIAISERIGSGAERRYRIRLMGSGIVQHYGEHTGKIFEAFVPPEYLDRWYAVCDVTLLAEKAMRMALRADTFGKSYLTAECFCAPLQADGGSVKFVLTGMAFDGRRSWNAIEAEARQKQALAQNQPNATSPI